MNLYQYVLNNPLAHSDPMGQFLYLDFLFSKTNEAMLQAMAWGAVHTTAVSIVQGVLAAALLYAFIVDETMQAIVVSQPNPLGILTAAGEEVLGAGRFTAALFQSYLISRGVVQPAITRALTAAELGITGALQEFNATFVLADNFAIIRIDMIQGEVGNPFAILNNMINYARAQGATVLRIEGTLANRRLYEILVQRYGLVSEGGTDYLLIPLE